MVDRHVHEIEKQFVVQVLRLTARLLQLIGDVEQDIRLRSGWAYPIFNIYRRLLNERVLRACVQVEHGDLRDLNEYFFRAQSKWARRAFRLGLRLSWLRHPYRGPGPRQSFPARFTVCSRD